MAALSRTFTVAWKARAIQPDCARVSSRNLVAVRNLGGGVAQGFHRISPSAERRLEFARSKMMLRRRGSSLGAGGSSTLEKERKEGLPEGYMEEMQEFLKKDLVHLFDEQGIDKSMYDAKVEFRDPITNYDSLNGYLFNIGMLRALFQPIFELHSVKQVIHLPCFVLCQWGIVERFVEAVRIETTCLGAVNPEGPGIHGWDGTYGAEAFAKSIKSKQSSSTRFAFSAEVLQHRTRENMHLYSSKYSTRIDIVKQNDIMLAFVNCEEFKGVSYDQFTRLILL